jgi:hypothetical protein
VDVRIEFGSIDFHKLVRFKPIFLGCEVNVTNGKQKLDRILLLLMVLIIPLTGLK